MTADTPQVPRWRLPLPLGLSASIQAMGRTAALMSGMAALAAVFLAASGPPPPVGAWAIPAFTTAAVAGLLCVQFTNAALGHAATPAERLDWTPAARTEADLLAHIDGLRGS